MFGFISVFLSAALLFAPLNTDISDVVISFSDTFFSRVSRYFINVIPDEKKLLLNIGTNADPVFAEFNEDFTCVSIYPDDLSEGVITDYKVTSGVSESPIAKYHLKTLKTVVFEEGIKNIGNGLFAGCKSICGEIKIPSSVERIGNYAFYNCNKITGVIAIPDDCKMIGNFAFSRCSSIESLTLGKNTASIGYNAFSFCSSLSGSLVIPDSVLFVNNYAFDRCTSVNSLYLGKSVEFIGAGAFQMMYSASNELILPDSLKVIGDFAFGHCSSFSNKELYIPENVEHIGGTGTNKIDKRNTKTVLFVKNYEDIDSAEYLDSSTHVFYKFGYDTCNFTEFRVAPENRFFASVDGVLYSRDLKRLVDYPTWKDDLSYEVPEGVEAFDELSLTAPLLKMIVLPDSYTIKSFADAPLTQINYENTLTSALYTVCDAEVTVKPTNSKYISENGILYSIDKKICYYLSPSFSDLCIDEGCERIEGASYGYYSFSKNEGPYSLSIPSTVDYISDDCSTTYPNEGTLKNLNHCMDGEYPLLTVDIPDSNKKFAVDGSGKIVQRDDSKHIHNFRDSEIVKDPTPENEGSRKVICSVCGYSQIEAIPATPPGIVKLTSASNTASCVKLLWKSSVGTDKYYIYRKISGDSRYKKIGETSSCSFFDPDVSAGTVYIYTVRAVNNNGMSEYDASQSLKIRYLGAPSFEVSNKSDSVMISCRKVRNISGYYIYRKTAVKDKWKRIAVLKSGSLDYRDKKAAAGKRYYYTVRTYTSDSISGFDSGVPITRITPCDVVSVKAVSGGVKISWSARKGATSYNIYRLYSSGWKKIAVSKDTSKTYYIDKNVKIGKQYTYCVRGVNGSSIGLFRKTGKCKYK